MANGSEECCILFLLTIAFFWSEFFSPKTVNEFAIMETSSKCAFTTFVHHSLTNKKEKKSERECDRKQKKISGKHSKLNFFFFSYLVIVSEKLFNLILKTKKKAHNKL